MELEKREKQIDFEAPTNIQFTSGTTGFPKGATLSHFNILNNSLYMGANLEVTDQDIICCPLPLYHCFGMVIGNLTGLNYGCPVVLPSEGFDPVATLDSISKHKTSVIFGVPTMYIAMVEELVKNRDKYDVSSLRTGLTGGS